MRVHGDMAPEGAFSLEAVPGREGFRLARFYENARQYTDGHSGETGWEYDEYHLILPDTGCLEADIEAELDRYREQARLAERDMSAENLYRLASEAQGELAAVLGAEGPDGTQAAAQLRRAVQLFAASLGGEQALEVAAVYPRYAPGVRYRAGQYITSGADANGDPILYRVVQEHTSQAGWPPEDSPALYVCLSLTAEGYPVWSPPSGAQDAYNAGDMASHGGTLYRSKIDGNTTEPGTDERWWEVVSNKEE